MNNTQGAPATNPASPVPAGKRLQFLREKFWLIATISAAVVLPCFWHRRIEAGDLGSHTYNAWLAQLIEHGQAPGLYLAHQWNNILLDVALVRLGSVVGFAAAEKILIPICVLIFFWGRIRVDQCVGRSQAVVPYPVHRDGRLWLDPADGLFKLLPFAWTCFCFHRTLPARTRIGLVPWSSFGRVGPACSPRRITLAARNGRLRRAREPALQTLAMDAISGRTRGDFCPASLCLPPISGLRPRILARLPFYRTRSVNCVWPPLPNPGRSSTPHRRRHCSGLLPGMENQTVLGKTSNAPGTVAPGGFQHLHGMGRHFAAKVCDWFYIFAAAVKLNRPQ